MGVKKVIQKQKSSEERKVINSKLDGQSRTQSNIPIVQNDIEPGGMRLSELS
jgi:hypothetical protein